MSTERELLEAAARAMGWEGAVYRDMQGWGEARYGRSVAMWVNEEVGYWNPRVGSHDALELAAALRISVEHSHAEEARPWVCASIDGGPLKLTKAFVEDVPDESQRADRMRLAILRCAAAQAPADDDQSMVAPWTDANGNELREGDAIQHPDGSTATIAYDRSRPEGNRWRAVYSGGESLLLGLQIGDRGQAVKVGPSDCTAGGGNGRESDGNGLNAGFRRGGGA